MHRLPLETAARPTAAPLVRAQGALLLMVAAVAAHRAAHPQLITKEEQ